MHLSNLTLRHTNSTHHPTLSNLLNPALPIPSYSHLLSKTKVYIEGDNNLRGGSPSSNISSQGGSILPGVPITQKLAEGEGKEDRLQSDGIKGSGSITPPPIMVPTLGSPRLSSASGGSGGSGMGVGNIQKSGGNSYHRGDVKVIGGSSSSTLPTSSSGITHTLSCSICYIPF